MKAVKVSVILPCYNVEKYISVCLDSLINQTLKDIEIICVDDKSTDKTKSIIKQYIKRDKRIRLIELKHNVGVSGARNVGIQNAVGQYIGFVDPDDYVDVDFYEKLYNVALINHYADIAKAEVKVIYKKSKNIIDIQKNILKNKYAFIKCFWSAIYKKTFLIDKNICFPEQLTLTEDTCFLINAVHHAKNVVLTYGTFYNYIRYDKSADSKEYDYKKCCAAIDGYKYLYNWLNSVNMPDKSYDIVLRHICNLSVYPWCKTKSEKCRKKLAEGMCDIITKKHKRLFNNVYGRKLSNAVYSKNIQKIIYVMNMHRARIRLFGKITVGHIMVYHNYRISIFNMNLLTVE